ncbi:MAG TPA: VOC family protein [Stellaceae bacterium]|nr:VOC family protein [Stellaceae bacterium]
MIDRIDHIVLTVRSLEATLEFYERVLGFTREIVPGRPAALKFGRQKFNVHEQRRTFEPKAAHPTPGAADFCLITSEPIATVVAHLDACGVAIEVGPVARIGALGPMMSVYFRDPDANLVEIARYDA